MKTSPIRRGRFLATATLLFVASTVPALVGAGPAGAVTTVGPLTISNPVPALPATETTCPTETLCIGMGPAGIVYTTGIGSGSPAWTTIPFAALPGSLTSATAPRQVSCPTADFCAFAGADGKVLTSTNPTGGGVAWKIRTVDPSATYRDIDCPTAALCVASGALGEFTTSTNPTGGAGDWTAEYLGSTSHNFAEVDCPTATACFMLDTTGSSKMYASANPAGGVATWQESSVGISAKHMSCPTTTLCITDGSASRYSTSTNPLAATPSWTVHSDLPANIVAVDCPRADLCVAGMYDGQLGVTTSPTGGSTAWNWADLGDDAPVWTADCLDDWTCEIATDATTWIATAAHPPGMLRVTTSPAVPSRITVDGHTANTWGLQWVQQPVGAHEVCFSDLEGYTTPACETVVVTDNATTTVTGTFVQRGFLKVVTSPPVAARISVDGNPADNWGVYTDLPVGSHQVCFGAAPGMAPPPCQNVTVTAGSTTTVTGVFTADPSASTPPGNGLLRVTTDPPVPSQISIDGQIADTWGLDWLEVASGFHEVCYRDVPGYATPPCATVLVLAGLVTTKQGVFSPNGYLQVRTNPALPATIRINGRPADAWGVYTDITPGTHEICSPTTVSGHYRLTGCQNVTVTAGATTQLVLNYQPIAIGSSVHRPEPG